MLMVLAGTISLVHEGIQCYGQKDFFEEHKGYSYVAIGLEDAFDNGRLEKIIDKLYKRYSAKGKEIALVEVEALNSTDTYLYADQGARKYLEDAIPELRSIGLKHKRYIIHPQKQQWNKTAQSEAREVFEAYSSIMDGKSKGIGESETDIFEYSERLELLAIDGESEPMRSSWHRNPIILFDNRSLEEAANIDYAIWQATMLNMTTKEWNDFVKEENLEAQTAYRTNVYENYLHQWQITKKGMLIGIVLSSILFLLEGIISRTIMRYEYYARAGVGAENDFRTQNMGATWKASENHDAYRTHQYWGGHGGESGARDGFRTLCFCWWNIDDSFGATALGEVRDQNGKAEHSKNIERRHVLIRTRTRKKKIILAMGALVVLFLCYSILWYVLIHYKYDPYAKGMNPTFEGKWEQWFLNSFDVQENGMQYSLLYPEFLSYTGSLAIADRTDTCSIIVWPSFFGKVKYGAMIQTENEGYQIIVDENLEPEDKMAEPIIQEYKKRLAPLMDEAKKRWNL